ncbi:HVA22-like protein a [Camellia lanceoleosa]|uniref:HVA22-like protein a n=1 Tax=Camellia lanceoleosa TaxID=1840588 RepID=A0ACC0J3U2_9ERIC|nr:HVA22-like protein a [Camellia lanceoleosa]
MQQLSNCRIEVCKAIGMAENQCELSMGMSGDFEQAPQVSSASVNLTTETAIVWHVSDAKVIPNWQKQLGDTLAKHLTSCGFKIPFCSNTKSLVTLWLVIPYFMVFAYVYEHYLRPFFLNPQQTVNVWYVPRKKDIFSKPDDILTAAEKYIEEHGPEAFEKLVSKMVYNGEAKCSTKILILVIEEKTISEDENANLKGWIVLKLLRFLSLKLQCNNILTLPHHCRMLHRRLWQRRWSDKFETSGSNRNKRLSKRAIGLEEANRRAEGLNLKMEEDRDGNEEE